ncbi:MAG: hypothetical protein OHK0013_08000 [Sandaracinaceae bacterium]
MSAPNDERRAFHPARVTIGAIAVLLGLLVALVAVRLARPTVLPTAPYGEAALGPLPAPGGTWDVLVREDARLRSALPTDALLSLTDPSQADDAIALDRAAVEAAFAELDPAELDSFVPVLDALYDGRPLLDGCRDLIAGCPHIGALRAEQRAELLVLSRWLAHDDEGGRALLVRVLIASEGLARSGRSVNAQLVGLTALGRAVVLATALARAGFTLGPEAHAALASVATGEIDLSRGWIAEVLAADQALRTVGQERLLERLFFDRATAARLVYESQERCIAYARDPTAPRPPPVTTPSSGPTAWMVSDTVSMIFVESMLVDCAEPIERARTLRDDARRRARALAAIAE